MRYSDIPAFQALATIDESLLLAALGVALLLAALLLRSILLTRTANGTQAQAQAERLPQSITKSPTGSYATR